MHDIICYDIGFNLTFGFGDKKSYTLYLKDYMKKLVARLEEKLARMR